jgi:hypothetical protein
MADLIIRPFVKYDPETGRIIEFGSLAEQDIKAWITQGLPYLFGVGSIDTHYVDVATKTILPRAENPVTLEDTRFEGLIFPGMVICLDEFGRREEVEIEQAKLELSFTFPGTYRLTVDIPSLQLKTFEIVIP